MRASTQVLLMLCMMVTSCISLPSFVSPPKKQEQAEKAPIEAEENITEEKRESPEPSIKETAKPSELYYKPIIETPIESSIPYSIPVQQNLIPIEYSQMLISNGYQEFLYFEQYLVKKMEKQYESIIYEERRRNYLLLIINTLIIVFEILTLLSRRGQDKQAKRKTIKRYIRIGRKR